MNEPLSNVVCPSSDRWLELLSGREDGETLARHPDLQQHLDACSACRAATEEVRRYQTLLLRAKVPALSHDQRQALDDRVRMLSSQWTPPPRVSPRVAWGVALAAAAVLVFLLARPFMERRVQREHGFAQQLSLATLPADRAGEGVATGAVDAGVEVSDRAGNWRALATGEKLRSGMRLRTVLAAAAGARVVVPGRFEIVLAQGSELDILSVHANQAYLRLRQGEVDCQVEKLRSGQHFAVMSAGFRASVMGTRFSVRHTSADSGVAVQVTEGAVRVDAADDPNAPSAETTTTVRPGQRWHYEAGRMALEPIPALIERAAAAAPGAATPIGAAPPEAPSAGTAAKPARAPAAKPELVQPDIPKHKYVIEVPPQEMTPEEVQRLEGGAPDLK